MIHRHLELQPGISIQEMPLAAIQDLLERGDLDSWRILLEHIYENPNSELVQRVARLVDVYPMYGTSPLIRALIGLCRFRGGRQVDRKRGSLAELRRSLGKTQVQVAEAMGVSQSDYSKLERRRDVRISTLQAAASAMNGRLKLLVEMPEGKFEVVLNSDKKGGTR